jgi:DNA-binding FadR family transcriptional regulator
MDEKLVRLSLSKQIVEKIERDIENSVWKVGEKIPPEPELIKRFGASRNTVREAVQALIHAGLLEALQGDGTYVRAKSRFEAMMAKRLRRSNVTETMEVRCTLEREISRMAALRRTPADLEMLQLHFRRKQEQRHNLQEVINADIDFHVAVALATQNHLLYDIYKNISEYLRMTINCTFATAELDERQVKSHTDLLEAIQKQDPDAAEKATLEIIKLSHNALQLELGE